VGEKTAWIDDPKLARQLARATWLVLVAAGVLLTRFPLDAVYERLALAALLVAVVVMNAPVVVGLHRSRAQSRTPAYRAVAVALGLRLLATAGVVFWVSSS
jgi:hypothetical protein